MISTIKPLSSAEPSSTPANSVRWRGTAGTRDSPKMAFCVARTWHAAREELMAVLGVGPGEIQVEMMKP